MSYTTTCASDCQTLLEHFQHFWGGGAPFLHLAQNPELLKSQPSFYSPPPSPPFSGKMRSRTLLMVFSATAWAKPLLSRIETTATATATSTIITAPLTDWIKNNHTDLQWYTTISVGTPPQNL